MRRLFKLFSADRRDDWTQAQREAFLDLLVLSAFADDYFSRSEKELVEDSTTQFSWDSEISVETYGDAIIEAVEAFEKDVEQEALLKSIAERLGEKSAKRRALNACEKVLLADGSEHRVEINFIHKVERVFGL